MPPMLGVVGYILIPTVLNPGFFEVGVMLKSAGGIFDGVAILLDSSRHHVIVVLRLGASKPKSMSLRADTRARNNIWIVLQFILYG